jgi:hypothetical protein
MLSGEISAALISYCHTVLALRAIAAAAGGFEQLYVPNGCNSKIYQIIDQACIIANVLMNGSSYVQMEQH